MDTDTIEDKENNGSTDQKTKNFNRRDSLGRGILKNLNRADENNTIAVMQLPLRDAQHANQGKSSYRRRVSFAPEVTLHKIELVPHSSGIEQRKPKRRETIAFAPSSSQGSIDDDDHQAIGTKWDPQGFEADGIRFDSDVEMEDDSHVYSSPNKMDGPNFAIHNDNMDDETVNMSISQNFRESDDEDNTMDLTKPLGNIQQMVVQQSNNPFDIPDQIPQSPTTEKSPRPFGSITSIFGSEAAEQDDHEQEMELTQPFSKVEIEDNGPNTQYDDEGLSGEIDNTMQESTMDLTRLAEGTTDIITLHNTKLNRETDLELNQSSTLHKRDSIDPETIHESDVSMDVTKLVSSVSPATQPYQLSESQTQLQPTSKGQKGNTTPLKPLRSHTSETGSPMSSKRKSRPDDTSSLNLRDRINSLTPKKRRKSLGKSQNIMHKEKADTVFPTSTQLNSQEEPKSSFTPLRSSKSINRKSIIGTQLISFPLESVEKVPLAPSHEEQIQESQEYIPVSLKQFLTDLSIEFFDNLNINDDLTITFNDQFDPSEVDSVDYLGAKTSKVPWLELYKFSCAELQKNMTELKRLFDNLNGEFAEENPPLVREYYQSIDIQQQKKMGDHLLFMKTLSDKEAEASWLTWRNQLLEELVNRLSSNLESLQGESITLNMTFSEISELEENIDNECLLIESQIEEYLRQNEVMEASENEDVTSLRQELFEVLDTYISEQEALNNMESQVQNVTGTKTQSKDLESQVQQKLSFIEINGKDLCYRMQLLKKSFLSIQSISGIKFNTLNGTVLGATLCDGLVDLKLNLTCIEKTESLSIKLSDKLPPLTQFYLQRYILNLPPLEITMQLNKVKGIVRSLNWLDSQLYFLGLICPVKLKMGEHLNIGIKEINKSGGYKANIEVIIAEQSLLGKLSPESITAKIVYGPRNLQSKELLNNWKSKLLESSWVQNFETLNLLQ